MPKKSSNNTGGKILLLVIGCVCVLWGAWLIALGVVGNEVGATVTSVRRQGGDLTNPRAGSYVYQIGYRFETSDGKVIAASTQEISSAASGPSNAASAMQVRYFTFFPYLSAPDKDTGLKPGSLIFMAVGGLLLCVALGKKRGRKRVPHKTQ